MIIILDVSSHKDKYHISTAHIVCVMCLSDISQTWFEADSGPYFCSQEEGKEIYYAEGKAKPGSYR